MSEGKRASAMSEGKRGSGMGEVKRGSARSEGKRGSAMSGEKRGSARSGRRLVWILLVSCVVAVGCSDKERVPGGILPTDKMEQVMWDMAQADQYAALYLSKDSAHIDGKAERMRLYAEVLRLHDVSPDEFRKSYRYYLDHPELNQLMFDSVIARGARARSEMYDRPSVYRAPVAGQPGRTVPAMPRPGAMVPGPGGVQGAMLQRMREAAARRRDSVTRAMNAKKDTTRRRH